MSGIRALLAATAAATGERVTQGMSGDGRKSSTLTQRDARSSNSKHQQVNQRAQHAMPHLAAASRRAQWALHHLKWHVCGDGRIKRAYTAG